MIRSLLHLLFFLSIPFLFWTQYVGSSLGGFMNSQVLCAVAQNQQLNNAAAFSALNPRGYQLIATAPIRVSNLGAFGFYLHYPKNKAALYHEVSGVFHTALLQFRTAHAIGYSLSTHLKVGVGLQLETYLQPSYYGHYLAANARLGCQYAFSKQHHLAFTLNNIGRAQTQQISIEHLQILQTNLFFAQGLSWTPHFDPTLYVSLTQTIAHVQLQLTCGLFPQHYLFSIRSAREKRFQWQLSQRWQGGLGPSFQIGLVHQ
jgi:hypothetical protein